MDKRTLDERCAELKARMLAEQAHNKASAFGTSSNSGSSGSGERSRAVVAPRVPEVPTVELRSAHPLIKAALAARHTGSEEYGKVQFRWSGHVDIRVSRLLVRRALKILDILFKLLETSRLEICVGKTEASAYQRTRQCTFATDRREKVEITVKEKTKQFPNPAWNEKHSSYSTPRYLYHSTGRLTLSLDDDTYGWPSNSRRTWSDFKGHSIEEYLGEVSSSIRQGLQDKYHARLAAEEERRREMERQRLQAEQQRQDREEAQRVEELKLWARTWRECEQLRAFVAAWEQCVEAKGEIQLGSEADAWRRWVLLTIDRLDPLGAD